MELCVGTSGFSYQEWKGTFYPEKIKNTEMLAYYSERLGTVEINNTFYRMPRAEMLSGWSGIVPAAFRFVIKTPQKITHMRRLKNVEEEMAYLLSVVGALGEQLGCLLVQLPPNFKKDLPRLEAFLDLLGDTPAAFEFRHPSWKEPDVLRVLSERNRPVVIAETDENLEPELLAPADWGYLRLRKTLYADSEITTWAKRIGGRPWKRAFVFFKHEQIAPGLAEKLVGEVRQAGSASS